MMKRRGREEADENQNVLNMDAAMEGKISFKDPVNLRINGNFRGKLDTKGKLTIGENAEVNADITGESIIVAGKVNGAVVATEELSIVSPANIKGDIQTPRLAIAPGAVFEGNCHMVSGQTSSESGKMMNVDELARYLELEASVIKEWADTGKIPAVKERNSWRFDKQKIDKWITDEKVKL